MSEGRKILHVDMDAFYAAVEQRDHPEWRGKPVVVGGSRTGRGVVATASYEARRYGIHSAMPSARAYRLCPHAIFARGRFDVYRAVSRQVQDIFHEVSDLVEPLSLDEAYIDVTQNHFGEKYARKLGVWIQQEIRKRTQLTASVGVSPLKLVSKVASDLRKPGGLVVVPPEKVDAFIAALPVEKLWSVGPVTAQKLNDLGIKTAGDIRKFDQEEFLNRFGKHGRFLYEMAHGRDTRRVHSVRERKSRGSESTFSHDITDVEQLTDIVSRKAIDLGDYLLRKETKGRCVTLKVRYDDFETITRSRTLPFSTADGRLIARTAVQLMLNESEVGRRPVRLVGVSMSRLDEGSEAEQLWLPFDNLDLFL